jgi:hypothetical protein
MSTAKFDTLSNLAGSLTVPVATVAQGSAKAWVNFNGTGTVAIRASFNVSSITDNGTGDYTVNFTTAMPDANYAFTVSTNNTGYGMCGNNPQVTGSFRLFTVSSAAASTDFTQIAVAIFR